MCLVQMFLGQLCFKSFSFSEQNSLIFPSGLYNEYDIFGEDKCVLMPKIARMNPFPHNCNQEDLLTMQDLNCALLAQQSDDVRHTSGFQDYCF